MDVVKSNVKKSVLSSKLGQVITIIILFYIFVVVTNLINKNVVLNKKDLLFAKVKQGELDVTVDGYGKLHSEKLLSITTLTRATVKEIILKPGAEVTKESIIVILANPELLQQLESAQQALSQSQANLRQLVVNQKRELLHEEGNLTELEVDFEIAKLRRMAEEKLVQSGIVSALTYKESVLKENQLNKRILIANKRLEQLSTVHQEAINIQQDRIKQEIGKLSTAKNRLDKLNVKAGINGVLQRLSVKLGESLSPGQEIALIGSVTELIALVRVPQNQAQLVLVGQKVEIDTRQEKIHGVVARINPIVEQNTVEVEIMLPNPLPLSARPQQNVDAVIITQTLHKINYIDRPANVRENSTYNFYKLNETSTLANKNELVFGIKTGRYIEIIKGAEVNDHFIISDLSNYKAQQITIN